MLVNMELTTSIPIESSVIGQRNICKQKQKASCLRCVIYERSVPVKGDETQ